MGTDVLKKKWSIYSKKLNFIFQILLLGAIVIVIYNQINEIQNTENEFFINFSLKNIHPKQFFFLLLTLLFIPINWALETLKWQKLLQKSTIFLPFAQAYKAVLHGATWSVLTPNRMGELLGRSVFLPKNQKKQGTFASTFCALSQMIVNVFCGTVAIFVFFNNYYSAFNIILKYKYILILSVIALFILYFFVPIWAKKKYKLTTNSFLQKYVLPIKHYNFFDLTYLLLFSFFRYSTYILQFWLLSLFFDIQVTALQAFIISGSTILAQTIIPSVALTEIGVRTSCAFFFANKMFIFNGLALPLVSLILWLCNLAFPALVGAIWAIVYKNKKKTYFEP